MALPAVQVRSLWQPSIGEQADPGLALSKRRSCPERAFPEAATNRYEGREAAEVRTAGTDHIAGVEADSTSDVLLWRKSSLIYAASASTADNLASAHN